MDNEKMENTTVVPDEDAAILPDGYQEGDDLFQPESWSGTTQENTGKQSEEVQTDSETADKAAQDTEEKPSEEQTQRDAEEKRNTTPTQNHEQEVVQLRRRVQQLEGVVSGYDALSKKMGFENAQVMMDKARENYREAEIKRLVEDPEHPVHPEVAREIVERRMSAATQQTPPVQQKQAARNFLMELHDLTADRPALRQQLANGGTLPQEVVSEAVRRNIPLRVAYAEHEAKQARAENEKLRRDLEIAKQNAVSAAKGPVKSATAGGKTNTKADDPFLRGFYSDD